jgi:hypothetical protein
MTINTAAITDLTWGDLAAAGIDPDIATRCPDQVGGVNYVIAVGDLRVTFGPSVDVDSNTDDAADLGWDICCEEAVDESWDVAVQHHADTPAEALRIAASWVAS